MNNFEIRNNEKKDILDIYVNDKMVTSIFQEDYYRLHIYEKEEITLQEIEDLNNLFKSRIARISAMKMILFKKRTCKEIKSKLLEQGIEDECIDEVVKQLKKEGYLNDFEYAKKFINLKQKQNKSKNQIKVELIMKGLNTEEIISFLNSSVNDEVTAQILLNKKFKNDNLKDEKSKKKAYMFLKNKGFEHDIIRKFVEF